jgi:hypothetical protein
MTDPFDLEQFDKNLNQDIAASAAMKGHTVKTYDVHPQNEDVTVTPYDPSCALLSGVFNVYCDKCRRTIPIRFDRYGIWKRKCSTGPGDPICGRELVFLVKP